MGASETPWTVPSIPAGAGWQGGSLVSVKVAIPAVQRAHKRAGASGRVHVRLPGSWGWGCEKKSCVRWRSRSHHISRISGGPPDTPTSASLINFGSCYLGSPLGRFSGPIQLIYLSYGTDCGCPILCLLSASQKSRSSSRSPLSSQPGLARVEAGLSCSALVCASIPGPTIG